MGGLKKNKEHSSPTSSDETCEERLRDKGDELVIKGGREGETEVRRRKKRGQRFNSFSSSVYDEDARWKAFNVERPDKPCHKFEDSPFSTSSGFHNFRGILNWCIVILVFTTGRAALENLIKYGVLIKPIHFYSLFVASEKNFAMVWVLFALFLSTFLTHVIERLSAKWFLPEKLILLLHSTTMLFEVIFPAIFVFIVKPSPLLSCPILSLTVCLFLKLVSYIQVNKWCRIHYRKTPQAITKTQKASHEGVWGGAKKVHKRSMSNKTNSAPQHTNDHEKFANLATFQHYPENLHLKDLCYYLLAPTVCYELNFPRTTRIRIRFLVKRALEIFFLLGLILSLVQQWISPTLQNSVVLFEKMNYPMMIARILKLAIPNHFIWLIAFYFIFHSCCNFQAELLMFGDRMFYKDWWNAENLQQFWSLWNIPIHRFALRHVYKPMLKKGMTKIMANASVFFVSAVFHEYLFSIPLSMLRPWFLVSFLLQTPLVVLSPYITGKFGNITLWLMLIIGQPVAIMMYYHDYFITNVGVEATLGDGAAGVGGVGG